MNTILIKVVSPSGIIMESEANMVSLFSQAGMFSVLPGHSKLTTNLIISLITAFHKDTKTKCFIYGGIAQLFNSKINVVTEFAINLSKNNETSIRTKIKELQSQVEKNNEISINSEIEKYQQALSLIQNNT